MGTLKILELILLTALIGGVAKTQADDSGDKAKDQKEQTESTKVEVKKDGHKVKKDKVKDFHDETANAVEKSSRKH